MLSRVSEFRKEGDFANFTFPAVFCVLVVIFGFLTTKEKLSVIYQTV